MSDTSDKHPVARLLGIVLPVLILVSAIGVSVYLVRTKPRPETRPPRERAAMVETMRVHRTSTAVRVHAAGTVIPATAIALRPEVSGRVTAVHPAFEPGGVFEQGDVLVEIDPRDYALQLALRRAELVKAEAAYQLELGRQDVAQHEWQLLSAEGETSDLDRELALRQPQLRQAEAALDAARAAVEKAEIDVQRARVRAPFNGVVRSRNINIGAQVTSQTLLAEIANSDTFWVLVTVPVSDLDWINVPSEAGGEGSSVEVRATAGSEAGAAWTGLVVRRLPDLEEAGRLAQLIVAVHEPLADPERPLLLGAYVDVVIAGVVVEEIVRVPRAAYREGDVVWVRDAEGRLEIRPVKPLWGDHDEVYVRDGLDEDDALVVTDLGTPVEGMKLVLPAEKSSEPPKDRMPGEGAGRGVER